MVDAKKSSKDYSNQMITTHGFNYVKNRRSAVREVTFGDYISPKKITKKSSLSVKKSALAKSIHLCVSNR